MAVWVKAAIKRLVMDTVHESSSAPSERHCKGGTCTGMASVLEERGKQRMINFKVLKR